MCHKTSNHHGTEQRYHIVARLQWIFFEHSNPKEWISPLPDAEMQVIFTEPTAADAKLRTASSAVAECSA
eukprot:6461427-Amphidinium_carterae.1